MFDKFKLLLTTFHRTAGKEQRNFFENIQQVTKDYFQLVIRNLRCKLREYICTACVTFSSFKENSNFTVKEFYLCRLLPTNTLKIV